MTTLLHKHTYMRRIFGESVSRSHTECWVHTYSCSQLLFITHLVCVGIETKLGELPIHRQDRGHRRYFTKYDACTVKAKPYHIVFPSSRLAPRRDASSISLAMRKVVPRRGYRRENATLEQRTYHKVGRLGASTGCPTSDNYRSGRHTGITPGY